MFPPFFCCVFIARRLHTLQIWACMQAALRPPLSCSVALSASTFGVWRLAQGQRVHSDSGPAVHFFLWITVHGPPPRVNTRAEWVHRSRQEAIHCRPHIFAENADKLRAATFTSEGEAEQASHIAAAGCVSACVCLKVSEIDHMIPFVHTHTRAHTQCAHQQTAVPANGVAVAKDSLGTGVSQTVRVARSSKRK